jgi:hypothetical protein
MTLTRDWELGPTQSIWQRPSSHSTPAFSVLKAGVFQAKGTACPETCVGSGCVVVVVVVV